MSDDNNNDDNIKDDKLNPSFHDLMINRKIDKLNPIFHDLGYQSDMAGEINHENPVNPSLEDAVYNDNINPPIDVGTGKNDSNPPKKKVYSISDNSGERKIKTKYYALRIIANILQIFAYIVGIVGVIVSIVVSYGSYGITRFLSGTGAVGSLLIAVGGIVFSVIVFIAILARAEQIKLFIDIEENTRAIELNTRPKNSQ
jgi:hypothetical protein